MSLRSKLAGAVATTQRKSRRANLFQSLVVALIEAGATVIPEEFWKDVCDAITHEDKDGDPAYLKFEENNKFAGWMVLENHARSMEHEEWTEDVVATIIRDHDVKGHKKLWVIPVDEFICLAHNDEMAQDFIGITRLFFVGTLGELHDALWSLREKCTKEDAPA